MAKTTVSRISWRVLLNPFLLCFVSLLLIASATATASEDSIVAQRIADKAGISKGLCSVLGCDDAESALELAKSGFYVHILDPEQSSIESLKRIIGEDRLYGRRIVAEKAEFGSLPYADNMLDLVIATCLTKEKLKEISVPEVMRVLRPNGNAILGSRKSLGDPLTPLQFKHQLRSENLKNVDYGIDDLGTWVVITKPPFENVDDWTHWEHGPDNNPVSTDAIIQAPYRTQWLGVPFYIAMPAITTAAGGRIFIAMGHIAHHIREEEWLNTLYARNGYNGTPLWKRKLPDGYLAHRSAFVATDDTFYMIDDDGNGCLLLDPETGHEKDRIKIPGQHGQWKWMVLLDDTLLVLAGEQRDPSETTIVRSTFTHWSWGELSRGYYEKRVPWGFGDTILAYDLDDRELLWSHTEEYPIDSRAMVVGDKRVYFYCPDAHTGCLDLKTGDVAWKNDSERVRELIEEPGRGLISTPGFRSTCYCLYTPKALFYEAQTRMNIVAVSKDDGSLMWHRKKTSNNPNMLYLEDHLIVGIGPGGSTLVLDPLTGETLKDLGFAKRSCARLTATPDSLFCRGWPEGLTRYDRNTGKVLFNGALRPSCNDGVIPANGLLYLGPWLCDCNLSLMGRLALCSSGDFDFNQLATETENLERARGDIRNVEPLQVHENDWATYRGDNSRSSSSKVSVARELNKVWEYSPDNPFDPTAPTSAGGLVFLGGDDGKVRAVNTHTGELKWVYPTAGPILHPPTIWNSRAYVGSGDGYVYALEAATGRLLWRFRAAPVERRIMVYGFLCSTWPVNTGVLVEDGVAYAAAGMIDYDGTYLYALDAVTGEILWQNNSSGHLDSELRKGVSAQGDLTIADGKLWMPGGNVISPAAYDLKTGEYLGPPPGDGSPRTNRGEEIGIFKDHYVVLGGRLQYSARKNVVNPGEFLAFPTDAGVQNAGAIPLNQGKIPPAWDTERFVCVTGLNTNPICVRSADVEDYLKTGKSRRLPESAWVGEALVGSDTVSIALASNAVLTVSELPLPRQLKSQWILWSLDPENGSVQSRQTLPSAASPGGILVDRDGRVIVVMEDGTVACYGGVNTISAYVDEVLKKGGESKQIAIRSLNKAMQDVHDPAAREQLIRGYERLGVKPDHTALKAGCVTRWHLIAPLPWNNEYGTDATLVGEPNVDISKPCKVGEREFEWRGYVTQHPDGMVNLAKLYGTAEWLAAYAYARVELPESQDLLLKIGSNDGFKCWFNGEVVGRFDGGRGYGPDQDTLRVHAGKGINEILLKITQMGSAWAFSARLTDLNNEPIDLTQSSK